MWESLKATDIETPDCLIPIPLGLKRLQMRGYNQSLELARSIHSLSDVPLHHKVLRREKETLAQSNLSRQERRRNLRGAFMVDPKQAGHIDGRHVALIDDVMTTGETLHAAAKVLKAHGARTITNLVFARTDLT
jgi:ComF family protein